jgi:hypothetical protein
MEYFIGSLSTLFVMFICVKFIFKAEDFTENKTKYNYSQSHIHEIVKPLLPPIKYLKKQVKSQSRNHEEKTNVRVIIMDNKAYWVRDNLFFVADMDDEGIDKDTTRVLDIMSMDKVQLDKMLFIVDKLRDEE